MRTSLIVVALSVAFSACGGDDSLSSPSTATTQPTTFNFSPTVPAYGYALQDVTVFQSAGQVTATLRWTDSGKDLDLLWTNAFCVVENNDFVGPPCVFVELSRQLFTETDPIRLELQYRQTGIFAVGERAPGRELHVHLIGLHPAGAVAAQR